MSPLGGDRGYPRRGGDGPRPIGADRAPRPRPPRNRARAADGADRSGRIRAAGGGARMATTAADFARRRTWVQLVGLLIALAVVARLGWVQLIVGPELSALAAQQRTVTLVDPARRGAIEDRSGNALAFTMEARSITVHPNTLRSYIEDRHRLWPEDTEEPEPRMERIAEELPGLIGVRDLDEIDRRTGGRRRVGDPAERSEGAAAVPEGISSREILDKLRNEESTYEVLVRNVDPDKAAAVVERFPELVAERQDIRQYPNGAVGANVIGKIGMDGVGQFGFEAARDATLQGVNGGRTVDIAANGIAIPGSTRDRVAPVDGTSYELTLDVDMQYQVQQQLEQAVANSGAAGGSAVVLDARSGEVLTMAQSGTANPNKDIGVEVEQGRSIGNTAVTSPFEPGSVAKVITAAAAIEDGVTTPDEVHTVPGSIRMAGVEVSDAWQHGDERFTTTGIFGKSSNVGTLMLADRVGQDRFARILTAFGLGQPTGVELPGETAGLVPSRQQWSGGTFANLPIGQGMAMSLLQMTGIYQTIANDGVRVPPRIIRASTAPGGDRVEAPEPEGVTVVSPETARTVREMFEAVVQDDPTGVQQGTGPQAAVPGYRIAGKTGTAQKVDEDTGAYSNSRYYITFAGIAPADDPRFVIGIMLDEPVRGVHGEGGQSAAPLFHDIAAWALDRYNVPPSPPAEGRLLLDAG